MLTCAANHLLNTSGSPGLHNTRRNAVAKNLIEGDTVQWLSIRRDGLLGICFLKDRI